MVKISWRTKYKKCREVDVKLIHRYLLHIKFGKIKILQIELPLYHNFKKIITQQI